jgi:hypothetical protein
MERLDVSDGFDPHDYRHGLKLLGRGRETARFANRAPFACPACGDPFDRLLVTDRDEHSFEDPEPFCLVRTDGSLLVLTH